MRFDFTEPGAADAWEAVDDVVMGGVSESALRASSHGAIFEGRLSTNAGGGFASVRSPEGSFNLRNVAGLLLRVRGDGKRYVVRLYTQDADVNDRVAYEAPFDAPLTWTELRVPFGKFRAVWRGREVPDAPPLEPAHITQVGLMIKHKQAGAFGLELARIDAYTD